MAGESKFRRREGGEVEKHVSKNPPQWGHREHRAGDRVKERTGWFRELAYM